MQLEIGKKYVSKLPSFATVGTPDVIEIVKCVHVEGEGDFFKGDDKCYYTEKGEFYNPFGHRNPQYDLLREIRGRA